MLGNQRPEIPTDRIVVAQSISHELMMQSVSTTTDTDANDLDRIESILIDEVNRLEKLLNAVVWIEESSHSWQVCCMPANSNLDDETARRYLNEHLNLMQQEIYHRLEDGQTIGQTTLENTD